MSVSHGSIRLHSAAQPALQAGEYIIRLEHTIDEFAATPVERRLEVVGPRFALPGTEVASVFPPPNSMGAFSTRLPEIVLKRRTLPWERRLGTGGVAATAPWLALVLLTPREAEFRTGVPVTEVIPAAKHAALGVGPGSGTCDCVQTARNVVQAVFPRADELAWLCHVREVSLEDTELAGGDLDGYFSVVLSARLPRPQRSYTAYLISVEGREDVLPALAPGPTSATPGAAEVLPSGPLDQRFPVLAQWSFEVEEGGDFQSLVQGLDNKSFGSALDGCPGVTPTGHVVTRHRSRRGEERAAWYRGPLNPREVARREPTPLFSADQARRIATDGLEDLSEAAAFEIGRLLAMADPEFVAALKAWRHADYVAGVAAETFGYVPGMTELGLNAAVTTETAPALVTLATLLSLGGPAAPLGEPVPRSDVSVPVTEELITSIGIGLGLDRTVVAEILTRGSLDPALPLPEEAAAVPLENSFDALAADPGQLEHLRQALRERVRATLSEAGLDPTDVFDPTAPAATVGEVFSGGSP